MEDLTPAERAAVLRAICERRDDHVKGLQKTDPWVVSWHQRQYQLLEGALRKIKRSPAEPWRAMALTMQDHSAWRKSQQDAPQGVQIVPMSQTQAVHDAIKEALGE